MKGLDETFLTIGQTKWSDHHFGKQKGLYEFPKIFFLKFYFFFGILASTS